MNNNYDKNANSNKENNKDKNKDNKNVNKKNDVKDNLEMDLDDLDTNNDKKLGTWQSEADIGPSRPPEFDHNEHLNTWQSDADIGPSRPPEFNHNEHLNTWQSDADIGPSRPPEYDKNMNIEKYYDKNEKHSNVPDKIKPLSKERDNEEFDYSDSSDSEENDVYTQIDLGTNRNKQRQLKRWDFDTEEEWKQYKDNCVILPKATYQYGMKLSDGRQKQLHHKSDIKSKDEKLNRELKQIEKIMDNKYRKSSKNNDYENSEHKHEHEHEHSSSSHSHSSHHHSSSKRHSRSRWDDDEDDRHNKRNRY